jgi:hypothetical protein
MTDIGDLHGVYPAALRWNAEDGLLSVSTFNPESGERELREIQFGEPATFALDLSTRERGYGLIRVGVYDMKLTPVGAAPPDWPGDDKEYKPAIGCWVFNPMFGEVRLETCATLYRQAVVGVWDAAKYEEEAIKGLQPIIRFVGSVDVPFRSLGKTFCGPVIKRIGWIERNAIPGWSGRAPTVALPKPPPLLAAASAPSMESTAKARHHKAVKPVSDVGNDQVPG